METIAEKEALACLRILVAIARADGTVHNDERKSLSAALESLELPGGMTVDTLLAEQPDVEVELAQVTSDEAREQLYRSAYFMAHADGTCSKQEQVILDRIAEVTGVDRSSLAGLFVGVGGVAIDDSGRGSILDVPDAITDPVARASKITTHVLKYSAVTAVLGAFPIPGLAIATDLAVIALQLKMVRDVGGFYGQAVDAKRARSILYSLGLGTGARLAVSNLAKFVPGWGSVFGAATAFASTYALGKIIDKFFASGGSEIEALKDEFEMAKKEGKKVYAEQKDAIVESQRAVQPALDTLAADLKAGKITQAEFDAKVAALA
jgi:uncharacterized protein (DUF697 family)/uncharacterized tellurite resistance protein B-like protein